MLAGLAAMFHRDEIGETQAKMLFQQMVEDLSSHSLQDISDGIAGYRRDGKNRFFPTSGQLLEYIEQVENERLLREYREAAAAKEAAKYPGGVKPREPGSGQTFSQRYAHCNRPYFWWLLPWSDPSWKESEIPAEYRPQYEKIKAMRGTKLTA